MSKALQEEKERCKASISELDNRFVKGKEEANGALEYEIKKGEVHREVQGDVIGRAWWCTEQGVALFYREVRGTDFVSDRM